MSLALVVNSNFDRFTLYATFISDNFSARRNANAKLETGTRVKLASKIRARRRSESKRCAVPRGLRRTKGVRNGARLARGPATAALEGRATNGHERVVPAENHWRERCASVRSARPLCARHSPCFLIRDLWQWKKQAHKPNRRIGFCDFSVRSFYE